MGKIEHEDFPVIWALFGPREKEDIVREYKTLSGADFSFEGFHRFFQTTYAHDLNNGSAFKTISHKGAAVPTAN